MINQLTKAYLMQVHERDAVDTGAGAASAGAGTAASRDFERLFDELHALWTQGSCTDSAAIINHVRRFVSPGTGGEPYRTINAQADVLGKIAVRAKADGSLAPQVQEGLNKALGMAIVNNGIFHSFCESMWMQPEKPEPW